MADINKLTANDFVILMNFFSIYEKHQLIRRVVELENEEVISDIIKECSQC